MGIVVNFKTYEDYIEVNQMKYWYEIVNPESNNDICLFLIHGFSGNRTRLQFIWDYFGNLGYNICRIDLKGHGLSQKTKVNSYSLDLCADEINEIIKQIFVKKRACSRVVIIAHSMGGIIAQKIAIKNPEYLYKLILISTVAQPSLLYRFLTGFGSIFYSLMKKTFFKKQKSLHSKLGLDHFPEWSYEDGKLLPSHESIQNYMKELSKVDIREDIPKINVPTLIFGGSDDDFGTEKLLNFLKSNIPYAKLQIYPDTGHFPYIHYYNQMQKKIQSFLKN